MGNDNRDNMEMKGSVQRINRHKKQLCPKAEGTTER